MLPDITQFLWIVWLGFILICVIIELLTLDFTFLMIAAGSLGGFGTNLLGAPWWVQILVAAILSVLLLVLIRPVLLRLTRKGADPTPSNLDALFGMTGRVVVPFGETGGQVKLTNGETWTAETEGPTSSDLLGVGATVTVRAIRGSVAIVAPTGRTPQP
ncbi:NfeD family protein [Naasia aerilata]|uniref:NfeD-like C-terminal domain-containing protein n=1 Tax=Naasia aerilata TaxID=1162966 RepID=A0ABM8GG31_9MICO|nr:NfeD family protein [Naasia aerilata]BDZ47289.1 hypothetical protein GCM10025866_31980 [Naasia aerilata]